MNGGAFILLMGLFSLLFLLIQRTEARRRRITLFVTIGIGLITAYWAGVRELGREFIFSLLAALILSGLFWLTIGRYNPVGDSDENIQVLGMDD